MSYQRALRRTGRWLAGVMLGLMLSTPACFDDPDPGTGCGFPGSPCPDASILISSFMWGIS